MTELSVTERDAPSCTRESQLSERRIEYSNAARRSINRRDS